MEPKTKTCPNCKKDFTVEAEDFNFYEKIKVPAPTWCPECRIIRRFVFRNERKLFKVKDAFTGESIFSLYPAQAERKIITQEEWHGDSWEGMGYAREIDFSRPFLRQIFELEKEVPVYNLNVQFMVNSPYSGNATALKNSYLCFNSNYSEDCMYGNSIDFCKDCVDNSHLNHSERCYESFWLQNCYQCYFSIMCAESHNLWFCRNCLGCNDCFGCANLRKSSYCIFNKKYTKEEYENEIKKFNLNTKTGIKTAREQARAFWQTQPTKYQHGLKNLNSTGSHVTNCKNVKDSFLIRGSENMRYCQYMQVPENKDCYDASIWGEKTELNYETMICGENSYNNKFSINCWPACKNNEYCMNLFSCSDCLGCVGLKKKQYCILNKQYSKAEYETLAEKIKKHMNEMPYLDSQGLAYKYGEFFPIEFSSYGYNNTIAMQHFPITELEAKNKGYPWVEVSPGEYKITKKAGEIKDSIDEIKDGILNEVIECENCQKAYRVMENELIFLRKEKLPTPNLCENCRFERRIKDRLTIKLYARPCMCVGESDITKVYKNSAKHFHGDSPCVEKFETGHAPEKQEIVYCEKCFQQEIY
jgi:hypothetical protein